MIQVRNANQLDRSGFLTIMDHSGFEARVLLAAYGERLADAIGASMSAEEIQGIVKRISQLGAIFTGGPEVLTTNPNSNTIPFHSLSAKLLAEIEGFLDEQHQKPTNFGIGAVNDGHLVHNLRKGYSVTLKTADKVRQYMSIKRSLAGEKQFYRLHD